jgi:hypothetical protein
MHIQEGIHASGIHLGQQMVHLQGRAAVLVGSQSGKQSRRRAEASLLG